MSSIATPESLDEVRQAMIDLKRPQFRGGGSKPSLASDPNLSLSRLRGVLSYDPGEFTFTALAGTQLSEIAEMLAGHGQFLAFDPPWVRGGSTLGGCVAAGISGSGRLRFGGVRDFLLGARLVTPEGRVVFGGGKVVKNAAGFDIPKLMVGGCGEYGALCELTFKVFPRVESYATVEAGCESLEAALRLQAAVASSPLEPACLDLLPPGLLRIRVGGLRAAQQARLGRLTELCRQGGAGEVRTLDEQEDEHVWDEARELTWAADLPWLARIAITPADIPVLEPRWEALGAVRRYAVAGNAVWAACPQACTRDQLHEVCCEIRRPGLVLRGPTSEPRLGPAVGEGFRRRLMAAFQGAAN